jgi:hypothetical protein
LPLFNAVCSDGHFKRILTSLPTFDSIPVEKKTCQCGKAMVRKAVGPTANVKETLDNGCMVKKLERFADAERLYHDRAKTADPNAGKRNRS